MCGRCSREWRLEQNINRLGGRVEALEHALERALDDAKRDRRNLASGKRGELDY